MGTLSKGYSFGATEEVTAAKLHALVDDGSVTGIVSADISNGTIVDDDIASVGGDKFINLASIPAGSGDIPQANLPTTITQATTYSDLTATTADINGGTIDGATVGANSASTVKATSIQLASGATCTGIADEDDMSSNSATLLATQQSIKAYVDALTDTNTSNSVYFWTGCDDITTGRGLYIGTDLSIAPGTNTTDYVYRYCDISNTANYISFEGFNFYFKKIAGISTLTIKAKAWCELTNISDVNLRLDIGSGSVTGTSTAFSSSSPTWQDAFTADVSGLSNGTLYLCQFQTSSNGDTAGTASVYISNVQVLGS